MAVTKKIFKAVAGRYTFSTDSRTAHDEGSQSKSKTFRTGAISKKTVILQGKKGNFIYDYNVKLHGGRESKTVNVTFSNDREWTQKVEK